MATEQNRRDADETGTFLDDTASLKDTGFLDDTDVLSSDTFEEESFLDDDVPEGAREFEGGEDDYAEDAAAYAYMTQPRAGLTENAPAKEQNPLPEGPEEKEEGRRRGSLLNWAIGLTAVAIAGVSVYLGIQISGTRRIAAAAASYASIGQSLEGISVIGGDLSKAGTIPVSFTLSTIQSDIKVKIRRDDNGSLISGVPFKISVADEAGKKTEYEDDDQDGIIYKTGIKNGKYTVTLEQLLDTEKVIADTDPLPEDFKLYSKFKIPEEPQTIAVTDKIAYKKVDVADEVKSESQVNVAKEDTARNDTVVESKIQDTVEWVESTKTEITDDDGTGVVTAEDGYQEVQKKDVPDPSLKAFTGKISGNFRRLSKELPAAAARTLRRAAVITEKACRLREHPAAKEALRRAAAKAAVPGVAQQAAAKAAVPGAGLRAAAKAAVPAARQAHRRDRQAAPKRPPRRPLKTLPETERTSRRKITS